VSKFAEVMARVESEESGAANEGGDGSSTSGTPTEVEGNVSDTSGASSGELGESDATAVADVAGGDAAAAATATKTATPPAVAKTPEEDRRAAQFAALKREKSAALQAREAAEARAREVQQREAALEAKQRELEGYLDDPTKLFSHLEKRHGIRSVDDLKRYADPAWRPAAPVKDEEKPLTRAELQAAFEEQERQRAQRDAVRGAEQEFEGLVTKDEKYEAAALIFSKAERIHHGHRIANELTRLGETFTLADVAEAVDELARQDERYAKINERFERKKGGAASASGLNGAKTATNPASQQRQQVTPAKNTADNPVPQRTDKNGTARLSHHERMQRMLGRS